MHSRAISSDAYSEPCQTSKMELWAKIVSAKSSILDVLQGSECASNFTWLILSMLHKNLQESF